MTAAWASIGKTAARAGGAVAAAGAAAALGASVVSSIPGRSWRTRVLDYPRPLVLGLGALSLAGGVAGLRGRPARAAAMLAGASMAVQLGVLLPYSRLARRRSRPHDGDDAAVLRLLIVNVLNENREADRFHRLVEEEGPDLLVVIEADEFWREAAARFGDRLPHAAGEPLPDGRGMLLLSRFPIVSAAVRTLVEGDRPSIRACIREPRTGRLIQFYALHPAPPGVRGRDGRRKSARPLDAELAAVGRELRALRRRDPSVPVIVAGDLNAPPWARSLRRFRRRARLLEPRHGRGLFNTFVLDPRAPMVRFPLDHVLHSAHFSLAEFRVARAIGSDHYPVVAHLALAE